MRRTKWESIEPVLQTATDEMRRGFARLTDALIEAGVGANAVEAAGRQYKATCWYLGGMMAALAQMADYRRLAKMSEEEIFANHMRIRPYPDEFRQRAHTAGAPISSAGEGTAMWMVGANPETGMCEGYEARRNDDGRI